MKDVQLANSDFGETVFVTPANNDKKASGGSGCKC